MIGIGGVERGHKDPQSQIENFILDRIASR